MSRTVFATSRRPGALAVLLAVMLGGCATVDSVQVLDQVNRDTATFANGQLQLAESPAQRAAQRDTANALLAQPLTATTAVQLALVNSPAVQALLAEGWAAAASAAQGGRVPNPVLALERVVHGDEREIGRLLSFGLLDLLTLPQRQRIATAYGEQARARLAGEVIDQVTQVRSAWVRAVAAQQLAAYARQVLNSAEASAELARRMEAVGNFNKLARARQQAFYADAATRMALAQQHAVATREQLVRALGLDDTQARLLRLPERLPDLPAAPRAADSVARSFGSERLDVRLAQAGFNAAARAQGLAGITTLTDVELGVRRDTVFDNGAGTRSTVRGVEIEVRLPVFDWGGLQRDAFNARTLAAAQRLEAVARAAASHLRESYSAYRTAYDIARHQRDEVVPLRKLIADENLLRYNGMLLGVFELLSDARDQVATVMAAIEASQQFWLADAALQATLAGRPVTPVLAAGDAAPAAAAPGH